MLGVPNAEAVSIEENPDSDAVAEDMLEMRGDYSVSVDTSHTTITPGSSSNSGDTVVLTSKSPIVQISSTSDDSDNSGLKEISNASNGEDDEVDSLPKKKGSTRKSKSKTTKNRAQQRYDRHRKIQTT